MNLKHWPLSIAADMMIIWTLKMLKVDQWDDTLKSASTECVGDISFVRTLAGLFDKIDKNTP